MSLMPLPAFNINKLFLRVRMHAYAVVVVVYILYFRGGNPKKWGFLRKKWAFMRKKCLFLRRKSEEIPHFFCINPKI